MGRATAWVTEGHAHGARKVPKLWSEGYVARDTRAGKTALSALRRRLRLLFDLAESRGASIVFRSPAERAWTGIGTRWRSCMAASDCLYPCAGQIPARNKVEPSAGVTFPLLLRREPEGRPEQQQRSRRRNARRLSLSSRSTPAWQAASAPMPRAPPRTHSPVSAAPGCCGDAGDRSRRSSAPAPAAPPPASRSPEDTRPRTSPSATAARP